MNWKRLQESIANCVGCVHFLNEKVSWEQKAKAVVQIKRISSSWGDTCTRAYVKIRTPSGPRSAGVMEGTEWRHGPLPQTLLSLGEGDRRWCSLLTEKAGDVQWEERAGARSCRLLRVKDCRNGRLQKWKGSKRGKERSSITLHTH